MVRILRFAAVATVVIPAGILLWFVLAHDRAHSASALFGAGVGLVAVKWRDRGVLRSLAISSHMFVVRVRPRAREMVDGAPVTAHRADMMRSDAKFSFQRGTHELALAQARTAMLMFGCLSADDPEWDALCASFGELMLQFGRPEACDRLMQLSLEHARVQGDELGCRELFYAKFLFDQGRLAEAEHHAIEAIRAPFGEVGFAHELLAAIRAAAPPSVKRRTC